MHTQGGIELPRNVWGLTPRQCDVLRCLLDGMSNKAISKRLRMSQGTVRVHVGTLMTEFNVTSRAAIAAAVTDALGLPRLSGQVPDPIPPPARRRRVQPHRRAS